MYSMSLVLVLVIVCGEALLDRYRKYAVTKVEIEWGQFDEKGQWIKPVQKAGVYAFYEQIGSEYVRLGATGGLRHYLRAGEAAGVKLIKSKTATIVCIGQPFDEIELIRTEPKSLAIDDQAYLSIVLVIAVAVISICLGLFGWFMVRREKMNRVSRQVQYQGQPQ